ncbi:OmpH family outer membrane protein [Hymenobacter metallicola]|uniref:OmpH family outer membrane protein n=1 Tax=Hymenobacter metallicola TaxID=2563114 RepID=A0A4Z0Q129_9BACT|nr:OmpH family outer membrane protein [Hymenobacter metallicola]TGE23385.1 OmpH family outer membrane protein [Hymenobacter metallicola]
MNNSLRLIIDAVLVVAVAVLFYLHFSSKPAAPAAPAQTAAVVQPVADAKDDDDTTTTVATPAAPVADTEKVAYVESGKLLDGYKGMQDARRSFEAKARGWERQNQALVTGFQNAVQQYQKQAESLTPEQRAATEQKLQQQQQQAGIAQEKLQRQAQEEEAKMTQQVLERVNKQIEKYGKDNGYKLILIAAPSGTIAYGRKDIDITDAVLKHLNREYSAKK